MIWDLYQQYQISQLESKVGGQNRTGTSSNEYLELRARLDKLALVNMAVWSLLKEHTPLTEEDLVERVKEIDLSDGQLDGKVRAVPQTCPKCSRTLSKKHRRCLYCGHHITADDAFSSVT